MAAFHLFQECTEGPTVDVGLADIVARCEVRVTQESQVDVILHEAESCSRELTRPIGVLRERYRRQDHLPEPALGMCLPGIAEAFEEGPDACRIAPDAPKLLQCPAPVLLIRLL